MLGCIHPMSSPMIKRMLGFCPCWAEAGLLAIVVAVHNTTRAHQITLNMLMVAFPSVGCRSPGRSLRPPPPTKSLFFAHAEACFGHTVGLPSGYEIGRSALDTLCAFGILRLCLRVALQ